ncbi:MAG: putative sulfate exporter family transporter, partial [Candidatus Omnitrophota bacterium]|nr:putative sulfate exporter family transporter [Candidatus Omnitrophota bacterium]
MSILILTKQGLKGVFLSLLVGIAAVIIEGFAKWPVLDPLLLALIIGIFLRAFVKFDDKVISGFKQASMLFIPIGVIFYGAINLNFVKFASVKTDFIFILLIVLMVYLISAILLSNLFKIKEKTGYLIAVGSAICGASAIAITSKSIDAEPDEVSTSLISVFISALIGLFGILPLLCIAFKMSGIEYGVFSATVLQFTGFVK